MTPFKRQGGFKKPFHKRPFNSDRPRFGNREHGEGRPEMHSATCDTCGNACEVPFRPSGERPVFCRDCFGKENRNAAPRRDDRPRFGGRDRDGGPRHGAGAPSPDLAKIASQLEVLNATMQRLATLLEKSGGAPAEATPAKKAVRKKKA